MAKLKKVTKKNEVSKAGKKSAPKKAAVKKVAAKKPAVKKAEKKVLKTNTSSLKNDFSLGSRAVILCECIFLMNENSK